MLKAVNIHKIYDNGKEELHVLKGVSLEIKKGNFIAVVGPSGAGKSTLLHILGGLDIPDQGEVIFEGNDIYDLNDTTLAAIRNKRIGFVFQFYHLLSEFTALENVLMPSLISSGFAASAGGRSSEGKDKALKLLEKVGLKDRVTHFPGQLSGGEKQRVAIARALMNNPDLLLCDEPTGNLDSKTGEEIIALIKEVRLENNMTVVLVTHNTDLAKTTDEVFNLKDGLLVN